MMGNFHSIWNLLSTIGKLFVDAGLRDLAVGSGVIAEGPTNKDLDGKQYNRAVWLHKLTHQTMMRLAKSGVEEWLEAVYAEALPKYNDTIRVMYNVRQNVCRARTTLLWPTSPLRWLLICSSLTSMFSNVSEAHMPPWNSTWTIAAWDRGWLASPSFLHTEYDCLVIVPGQNQLCKLSSHLLCPDVTFARNQLSIARPFSQWWFLCSTEKWTSIRQNCGGPDHWANGQQRYADGRRDSRIQSQAWCGVPLLPHSWTSCMSTEAVTAQYL